MIVSGSPDLYGDPMKGHADLYGLVGQVAHLGDLAEGAGVFLASQPHPAQVVPLRGELLAWADHLAGEAPDGAKAAEIGCLRGLTNVLGGYIDGHAAPPPGGETLRARVLSYLTDEGRPCRPSDLADALGKTRPQISTVLRSLAEDGLVARDERARSADGRVALYRPTAEGVAVVAAERGWSARP